MRLGVTYCLGPLPNDPSNWPCLLHRFSSYSFLVHMAFMSQNWSIVRVLIRHFGLFGGRGMTVISFLNILLNLFDFFDHADHCSDGRGRATSESIALVSGSQK